MALPGPSRPARSEPVEWPIRLPVPERDRPEPAPEPQRAPAPEPERVEVG